MLVEDTPEQKAVIRQRQMACKHGFIRGACDKATSCVHCGVSLADWEQMQVPQFNLSGWAAAGGGGVP